jgi:hypothetical protein
LVLIATIGIAHAEWQPTDPAGTTALAAFQQGIRTGLRTAGGIDPARVIAVQIIRAGGDAAFPAEQLPAKRLPPVSKTVRWHF